MNDPLDRARALLVSEASIAVKAGHVTEALTEQVAEVERLERQALPLSDQLQMLEHDDQESFAQRMAEAGLELAAAELIVMWDTLAQTPAFSILHQSGLDSVLGAWSAVAGQVTVIEKTLLTILAGPEAFVPDDPEFRRDAVQIAETLAEMEKTMDPRVVDSIKLGLRQHGELTDDPDAPFTPEGGV